MHSWWGENKAKGEGGVVIIVVGVACVMVMALSHHIEAGMLT